MKDRIIKKRINAAVRQLDKASDQSSYPVTGPAGKLNLDEDGVFHLDHFKDLYPLDRIAHVHISNYEDGSVKICFFDYRGVQVKPYPKR